MGWVVNATPLPLYPLEKHGTYCIGGWVGPKAGLDGCRKISPPLGFNSRTFQPVASRYTDCDIPAQGDIMYRLLCKSNKIDNMATKFHLRH
jgi:hypothetical protein